MSKITTSDNHRDLAWKDCGAADCTYNVEIIKPLPVREVASDIKELSFTLPATFKDDVY